MSRRSTIRCTSCRATYWSDDAHRCEVAPVAIDARPPAAPWKVTRRGLNGPDGYAETVEHRRVVGKLELLVEHDPASEDPDVFWHVICEGNSILLGKIGTRSTGPISFLMARGRRAAEQAVGIDQRTGDVGDLSEPLRLHPGDIEAIAARVLSGIEARRG